MIARCLASTVLGLALVTGACGPDKAAPAPPPAERAPTPAVDGLTVLEPGAAPLHLLRYTLAPGARTTVELALDLDIDAGGLGGTLPTVIVQSEIAVLEVRPDASALIRTTILDVRAQDRAGTLMPARSMTEHMQLLRGIALVGELRPDGGLGELALGPTATPLPPALAQQLDSVRRGLAQLAMPLPTTPVGIGARWTYGRTIRPAASTDLAVDMHARTTITLTDLALPRVTFTSTTEVTGADQRVTQAGLTVAVSKIAGTGHGAGTLDLGQLTLTGELAQSLTSVMEAGGETTPMRMDMATRFGPPSPASAAVVAPPGAPPAAGSAGARETGH